MQKANRYQRGLLLCVAAVVFSTVKIAIAMEATSQPGTVAKDLYASEAIPTGFNSDRYARVWERNPFTFIFTTAPQPQRSAFDKLFLTSWLKDGRTDVIFVQNLETNEVQKVTAQPNKDNLRLVALHLSSSPQTVEALISDGKEQGLVKFRFDVQSAIGQTAPPITQIANRGVPASTSNPAQAVSPAPAQPQSNPQTSTFPATAPAAQPRMRAPGSGISRPQGGQGPGSRGETEGTRLPLPGQRSG